MKPKLKKFKSIVLAVLLFATTFSEPANAIGDPVQNCKIERNAPFDRSPVSVGFPIHPDRYVGKTEVNVLVASFELADVKYSGNIEAYKQRDANTADLISRLSRGKVKINFAYTDKTYTHRRTLQEWQDLKAGQHEAYGAQNEAKSTWGFVREAIQNLDKDIDYSKVDTVVLQGPFDSRVASEEKTAVYEAFMTISEANGFFRPFATNEKNILNAFVMSGTFEWLSYAHELLHNFGLTDLYDMNGTIGGPLAYKWSLFSSGNPTLFYWERWQLDWLNESEVVCFDLRNDPLLTPKEILLNFKDRTNAKLIVIRTGPKAAYAVELREPILLEEYKGSDRYKDLSGQALVTYSVQSDRIPAPIRLESQPNQTTVDDLSFDTSRNVGNYVVHILDSEIGQMKIGIWSNSLSESKEVSELKNAASKLRQARLIAIAEQEAAALKAKQEAEAKAKQEAEAKVLAEKSSNKSPAVAPKKTITCVKGKTLKKVTSINPKCPYGYKKK